MTATDAREEPIVQTETAKPDTTESPVVAKKDEPLAAVEPPTVQTKLSARSPAFVPAYCNPLPTSSLRVHAKAFVPTPQPKSLLAEELDMGLSRRPLTIERNSSALAGICNSLTAHMEHIDRSVRTTNSRTVSTRAQRDERRSRNTTAAATVVVAATKRPAAKRANVPSKRMRLVAVLDDGHGLQGVPLQRSGVSNLFDELELKPVAVH